jgi:FtsP/CotA-like multicopper oxidase with cupredoxin domain
MTMLGTLDGTNTPVMQEWADPISQVMKLGQIEEWELYNFTQDAHPMHIHGTRFRVVDRQSLALDTANPLVAAQPAAPVIGTVRKAEPNEAGYKDVVVSNPREVTRLLARWERAGVYTWHCHIVEHEDNEMMLPMCVRPEGDTSTGGLCVNPNTPDGIAGASPLVPVASGL